MSFEEGLFIENIEQFPCLWDLKCLAHKDKLANENAWSTISSVTDMSVEECQALWKSIRLKYVRERKLITEMPSGSASYSGSWSNFAKLGFLAPHIQIRKTKSNIVAKKRKHSEPIAGPSNVWSEMTIGEEGYLHSSPTTTDVESVPSRGQSRGVTPDQIPETEEDAEMDAGENAPSTARGTVTPEVTPNRLRQARSQKFRKTTASEEITKICASVGQDLSLFIRQASSVEAAPEPDEDDLFCRSLGLMLKKLKNETNKTLLKANLLTMVADAQRIDAQE